MKATALLKTQHKKVKSIFKKLGKAHSESKALVTALADDLAAHMLIEEVLFYPTVRKLKEALVLEGYEEHAIARFALKRLLATSPADETFKAKVTALKEIIDVHVEEEEQDLFPKVSKAMSAEALSELGAKMKALFDATVASGHGAAMRRLDSETREASKKRPAMSSNAVHAAAR